MTHTVYNHWMGEDETATTLLELMKECRVFRVAKMDDGRFEIEEMCDQYFGVDLTREQLLALADELRELAGVAQADAGRTVPAEVAERAIDALTALRPSKPNCKCKACEAVREFEQYRLTPQ